MQAHRTGTFPTQSLSWAASFEYAKDDPQPFWHSKTIDAADCSSFSERIGFCSSNAERHWGHSFFAI